MEIIEKIKLDSKKINFDNIEKPLKCIGYFVLGFVLSTGTVMENLHPFGISITAVSKKRYFIFSALGACLGYIVCGVDAYGARYLAATVMAGLGAYAAFTFDLNYRPAFSMALSFLLCLIWSTSILGFSNTFIINLCINKLSSVTIYPSSFSLQQ